MTDRCYEDIEWLDCACSKSFGMKVGNDCIGNKEKNEICEACIAEFKWRLG